MNNVNNFINNEGYRSRNSKMISKKIYESIKYFVEIDPHKL